MPDVIQNKSAGGCSNFEHEEASMPEMSNPKVLRSRLHKFMIGLVVAVCVALMLLIALVWTLTARRNYVPPPDEGAVMAAAELRANMDPSAEPCDDFYQYACGGWMKKYIIPDDTDSWSNFVILRDETATTLINLINTDLEIAAEKRTKFLNKALFFYQSCLDTSTMDGAATDTIQETVTTITAAATKGDALAVVAEYNVHVFYVVSVDADSMQPDQNALFVSQGALGLSLKEEYISEDSAEKRGFYQKYLKALWTQSGIVPDNEADALYTSIFDFEKCVAEVMFTPEELRTKSDDKEKMTFGEFKTQSYAATMLLSLALDSRKSSSTTFKDETMVYFFEVYVKGVDTCLTTKLDELTLFKRYIATRFMLSFATVGKEPWRDAAWQYSVDKTKVTTKPPRWKTCLSTVTAYMPEVIGRIFSKEVFTPKAKENTLSMIADIKTAFKEILPTLEWMDDETRKDAKEKADAVDNKIGYPDWIMDDAKLNTYLEDVDIPSTNDLITNVLELEEVLIKKEFDVMSEAVDKSKWYMSPATVNAYYNPKGNEMVFPAAILQPPFYHESYPTFVNYGAIGVVIGHELTHGFDDNGRKYDKTGKKEAWGTEASAKKFTERAECLKKQYSGYSIAGSQVSGELTLGENIADNGGVKQAYIAYSNWVKRNGKEPTLPGLDLTNKQALFVSYAQIWCQKKTKEAFEVMVRVDPHSPGMFRVKGPLVNSKEFAEAYNCAADAPMNPPVEDKCEVW